MSIQSEISRVKDNVLRSYTAVAQMGGTVPAARTSENLAEAILGIPQVRTVDGTPIGTVISFMGTAAPAGYLVCDGTEYSLSEYPQLAEFFAEQFHTANYFGGDGENTFAVPDMRNLFLRGYHGEAEEQLSGGVGERQEATEIPGISYLDNAVSLNVGSISTSKGQHRGVNVDTFTRAEVEGYVALSKGIGKDNVYAQYTARPVNMAVLYCIKAGVIAAGSGGNNASQEIYSTEEIQIGTWIDGKPLYRKTITSNTGPVHTWTVLADISNIDNIVNMYGFLNVSDSEIHIVPDPAVFLGECRTKQPSAYVLETLYASKPCTVTVEYTKTTISAISIHAPLQGATLKKG